MHYGQLLVLTLALCGLAAAEPGLSPPWWIAYGAFRATVPADSCANVTDLVCGHTPQGHLQFSFNVTLCPGAPRGKAAALSTFLTQRTNYGGTYFRSEVVDAEGEVVPPLDPVTAEQSLSLAAVALEGNSYFVGTHVSTPLWFTVHWVEFKPEVIQYFDDNIADYNGNSNFVAADLFSAVFRLEEFGLLATTQKISSSAGKGAAPASAKQLRLRGRRKGPDESNLS